MRGACASHCSGHSLQRWEPSHGDTPPSGRLRGRTLDSASTEALSDGRRPTTAAMATGDDGALAPLWHRPEHPRPGVCRGPAEPRLGRGHTLCVDGRGVGICGGPVGPIFS
jgi:hypothetical protein